MKTKYNFIKLFCVVVFFTSCKISAQITSSAINYTEIPLVEFVNYLDQKLPYPEDTYFKDVDNDLDKYIGTWQGTHNNKVYEMKISKVTDNLEGVLMDLLIIRYKITGPVGEIIINTYDLNISSGLIVWGNHLAANKSYYSFDYVGENVGCGSDSGGFYLRMQGASFTQMRLTYSHRGEVTVGCSEISNVETFPISLDLTKQ